jgi:hypothetical protein
MYSFGKVHIFLQCFSLEKIRMLLEMLISAVGTTTPVFSQGKNKFAHNECGDKT